MVERLTSRQTEILRLIADGLPHKVIASELGVAAETIRSHCTTIYRKLGASNAPHAVAIAKDNKMI